MSYKQNNVTFIDDLPSIEDLEYKSHGLSMIPPNDVGKYTKFIRNNNYNAPNESGMQSAPIQYSEPSGPYTPFNNFPQELQQPPPSSGGLAPNSQMFYEPYEAKNSCVDMAQHAANCPVCSRLYTNDKTWYILTIIILCIICILLLKKVIDV